MVNKITKESITIGEAFSLSGFFIGILSIITLGELGIGLGVIGGGISLVQFVRVKSKVGKVGLILSIAGIILSILSIIILAKNPQLLQLLG